jgi:hypothetical protein
MIPLSHEDLQSGKVRAWATNVSTGATQELTIKNGSVCQFFEPFKCGGYKIWLRLHWKDLDSQGNPTLDADFYNPSTDKIDKSMRAHPAHHTQAQGDKERTYLWMFADESRELRVTLTWSESVTSVGNIIDSCSAKQTRAGEEVP